MPSLILDPMLERSVLAERNADASKHDEVWEGVYVYMPLANSEHQQLVARLSGIIQSVFNWSVPPNVFAGVNVSDRIEEWTFNYREPDVAVFLAGSKAINCGTHWCGGPDFLSEIVSPGEDPRDKMPFYTSVNSREVLIIDRDPWRLELYQLQSGQMAPAGQSDLVAQTVLTSSVLPLTFRLVPGTDRPHIEVVNSAGGQTWLV
jgi:Uma2 family endonuclease